MLAAVVVAGAALVPRGRSGGGAGPPSAAGAPAPPLALARGARSGALATVLRSRPDLRPPEVVVDHRQAAPDAGLVLITPRIKREVKGTPGLQQGGMLVDEQGRVRWFGIAPDNKPVIDLQVQRYRGRRVLTWWQGAPSDRGFGTGVGMIVDRRYRTIATVRVPDAYGLDLHELRLTPRGTALVVAYRDARRNGRTITEGVAEEIDVASGRVLWEWNSLARVPPSESVVAPPQDPAQPFDYFHINSVDESPSGRTILVSARNTSAIYAIDRATGRIRWRLGGRRSDFAIARAARFGLQHDARFLGKGRIGLFDNGPEQTTPPSSGEIVALDRRRRRARLVRRFVQPQRKWARTQGSMQRLPGGGAMVGWGSLGRFSRFGPAGELLFDAHLPEGYHTYRAFMGRWRGDPLQPPALAAQAAGRRTIVYASWNGSTEVESWQVLAGPRPGRLEPVGPPAEWAGLETAISRPTRAAFVAVRALDGRGRPLARSAPLRVDR